MSDDELERRFHRAMIQIYERSRREIKYTPTYFLQMVNESGGLGAAKQLLQKDVVSEGFTTLYLSNRLDLSVEAHVIRGEFRPLFTDEEIAIAEQRLRDVGYRFDE